MKTLPSEQYLAGSKPTTPNIAHVEQSKDVDPIHEPVSDHDIRATHDQSIEVNTKNDAKVLGRSQPNGVELDIRNIEIDGDRASKQLWGNLQLSLVHCMSMMLSLHSYRMRQLI